MAFVAYSYLGVEVVGVTAFEARDLKDLRRPSKTVAYVVLIMYFAYAWAEVASVSSTDDNLDRISDDIGQTRPNSNTTTSAILILVATNAGYQGMKSAFTIIVICSGFSASNIALYVASRTLYGLSRGIAYKGAPFSWMSKLSDSGVPIVCVVISGVFFCWIPFSQLVPGQITKGVSSDVSTFLLDHRVNHDLGTTDVVILINHR